MKTSLMALCLILALISPAQAALIDDGEYFFDDSTGYRWMDLTNFKFMTYDEVAVQLSGTDFSIATLAQLEQLWSSTYEYDFEYLHDMIGGVSYLNLIVGVFDNELDNDTAGFAWTWDPVNWKLEADFIPYDDTDYNVFKNRDYIGGLWVVNTSASIVKPAMAVVPEPGTMLLLSMGVLGLAALRRR